MNRLMNVTIGLVVAILIGLPSNIYAVHDEQPPQAAPDRLAKPPINLQVFNQMATFLEGELAGVKIIIGEKQIDAAELATITKSVHEYLKKVESFCESEEGYSKRIAGLTSQVFTDLNGAIGKATVVNAEDGSKTLPVVLDEKTLPALRDLARMAGEDLKAAEALIDKATQFPDIARTGQKVVDKEFVEQLIALLEKLDSVPIPDPGQMKGAPPAPAKPNEVACIFAQPSEPASSAAPSSATPAVPGRPAAPTAAVPPTRPSPVGGVPIGPWEASPRPTTPTTPYIPGQPIGGAPPARDSNDAEADEMARRIADLFQMANKQKTNPEIDALAKRIEDLAKEMEEDNEKKKEDPKIDPNALAKQDPKKNSSPPPSAGGGSPPSSGGGSPKGGGDPKQQAQPEDMAQNQMPQMPQMPSMGNNDPKFGETNDNNTNDLLAALAAERNKPQPRIYNGAEERRDQNSYASIAQANAEQAKYAYWNTIAQLQGGNPYGMYGQQGYGYPQQQGVFLNGLSNFGGYGGGYYPTAVPQQAGVVSTPNMGTTTGVPNRTTLPTSIRNATKK